MATDSDWVEDVRRWYFNGGQLPNKRPPAVEKSGAIATPTPSDAAVELGYEAAEPGLQAKLWSDTGHSGLTELR